MITENLHSFSFKKNLTLSRLATCFKNLRDSGILIFFSLLKSGMTFAGVFQKAGNVFVTSAIVLGFRFLSAKKEKARNDGFSFDESASRRRDFTSGDHKTKNRRDTRREANFMIQSLWPTVVKINLGKNGERRQSILPSLLLPTRGTSILACWIEGFNLYLG